MNTGLILESFKLKDISHERIFGSAAKDLEIKPLNRDTSGIPIVFQGTTNSCVSCTLTWIRQWMEKQQGLESRRLSWPFLFQISNSSPYGATPSQVLEPARKQGISKWETFAQSGLDAALQEASNHRIPAYSFVTDYRKENLYKALTLSPLAIGCLNWKGRGDHMMAVYDVTDDGSALKCKSWWDEDYQTEEVVQFDQVEVAISFEPFPEFIKPKAFTIQWDKVFIDMIASYFKYVQKV